MGLALLVPLALAGLAAVAIPILVHLVHRRHAEGTPFPSLMFLHQVPVRVQRRQRIRHWPLLLIRCLAVILIVLAFARPFLGRPTAVLATEGGRRDLVAIIDRSFSMGYGNHWRAATRAVRDALTALGPDDRATIVAFDEEATAMGPLTGETGPLLTGLDSLTPGERGTRFAPALTLARRLLEGSDADRRDIVMVSDFQRVGWDRGTPLRLPAEVGLAMVDVSEPDPVNTAVGEVTLRREIRAGRERVQVAARVINTGPVAVDRVTLHLELNGQVLGSQTVAVEAGGSATATFASVVVPSVVSRGVVRIDEDPLPVDNTRFFVLTPGRGLPTLIVEPTRARENQSLYLERALAVGKDPTFPVRVRALRNLQLTDLDGRRLIILNDAAFPTGPAGGRLRRFVEHGGGLLLVLGAGAGARWPGDGAALLPGSVGSRVEARTDRGLAVAQVDFGHPVFQPFSAPRSGDLATGRVFRYRSLSLAPDSSVAVLARYDDGGVAVAERRVGRGRVAVLTTTTDTYWNTLALQPVFVPFVQSLATYLAGYRPGRLWYPVGSVVNLAEHLRAATDAPDGESAPAPETVETPAGLRQRLEAGPDPLVSIGEAGFYDILDARRDHLGIVAGNVSVVESDLRPLDPETLHAAVGPRVSPEGGRQSAATLTPEEQERRQGLWWYLLMGAAVLLAGETLIANHLSRGSRETGGRAP